MQFLYLLPNNLPTKFATIILNMRYIFILLFFIPVFAFSQVKKNIKTTSDVKATTKAAFDGFIITGSVTGFPDGTPVSFLNEQTGLPEQQAVITKGKFIIKGKMQQPGFKGLIFNNAQPLVPLFLDNSNVMITGNKDALDKLVISGSPSHTDYEKLITALKPYEQLFSAEPVYDPVGVNNVVLISDDFVKKNPSSYVSPLAIIRLYQASQNGPKMEELYNTLQPQVKYSDLGNYITKLITESKINPIGSLVADFSQTDTAGVPVNISAFKGKYVLVDFWASWCRPCRQENPNVVAAYQQFKNKNFTVLGVSLDQNKKAWLDAIKMDSLTWSHISDLKGWGNQVAAIFQVSAIPQNLLLDPEGRIIAKNLRGGVLLGRLNALLK